MVSGNLKNAQYILKPVPSVKKLTDEQLKLILAKSLKQQLSNSS